MHENINSAEIKHRMGYHPATATTGPLHDQARKIVIQCAEDLLSINGVEDREGAVVLTKLEEALFWCNAGIARNHSARKNLHGEPVRVDTELDDGVASGAMHQYDVVIGASGDVLKCRFCELVNAYPGGHGPDCIRIGEFTCYRATPVDVPVSVNDDLDRQAEPADGS